MDLQLQAPDGGVVLPSRIHAIVLVACVNAPMMRALAFARASRPSSLVCLHVSTDRAESARLSEEWERRNCRFRWRWSTSYRDITRPVLDYIANLTLDSPRDVVSVYVPEHVTSHWWQAALHNQSSLRLKTRLLFQPRVMVTSVPTVVD